jgi:hypothetical protein
MNMVKAKIDLKKCRKIASKPILSPVDIDMVSVLGYDYLYEENGKYFLKCTSFDPYAGMDDDYPHIYMLTRDEARKWADDFETKMDDNEYLKLFPEMAEYFAQK